MAEGRENGPVASSSGVESSRDFRMEVEDVFAITGRGIVVTGTVASGRLVVGGTLAVTRNGRLVGSHVVKDLETFWKRITQADAGDEVGVVLANAKREDFMSGDVLTIR